MLNGSLYSSLYCVNLVSVIYTASTLEFLSTNLQGMKLTLVISTQVHCYTKFNIAAPRCNL